MVTIAEDGVIAVREYLEGDYDLILMDMRMPRMDGLEATGLIRGHERGTGERIPIIALTANAMRDDIDHCLAAGMDDHLSKPIDIQCLHDRLGVLYGDRDASGEASPVGVKEPKSAVDELQLAILDAFRQSAPEQLVAIHEAHEARDIDAMADAVHSLRGGLLALGGPAAEAALSAGILERRLRGDGLSAVAVVMFEELEDQVRAMLSEHGALTG